MRVIIINSDEKYCETLEDTFRESGVINTVGVSTEGYDALRMIKEIDTDVILLDFIMSGIDGLGILDSIKSLNLKNKPAIIMLSSLASDIAVRQAEKLGASYFIVRPFDNKLLCRRINEIYLDKCDNDKILNIRDKYLINESVAIYFTEEDMKKNDNDIGLRISSIMKDIGVPLNLIGYNYIKLAILQTINLKSQPDFQKNLLFTKDVYPYVASLVGKTGKHIQQNIRNTITRTWQRGGQDFINSIFGYTINYTKGRPTNTEFICMMTDKIMVLEGITK
jgi:two-component system response regulator (stage 0 sporulation protein A)